MTERMNTLLGRNEVHKVVVVGGGFAGVRAALDIAKKNKRTCKVTIITDKPYFSYYPAMYRVATGSSPLEARIPMSDILGSKNISFVHDLVTGVNTMDKKVITKSGEYEYDSVILALGSVPRPVPIPDVADMSYNFLTISEAIRMRKHVDAMFTRASDLDPDGKLVGLHFIIVGAGASGVEVAGELATYAGNCARCHSVDPSLITIDLVDRANRVLPRFSEKVSEKVARRLRLLGVNIYANRSIKGTDDAESLQFGDMELGTRTLIWTAGTKVHPLYETIEGLRMDERGRILVGSSLEPEGMPGVFVVGDAASTKYAGLAQTALHDGGFVARVISRRLAGKPEPTYKPKTVFHNIPVGPGWAFFKAPWFAMFGKIPWVLRHIIDIKFYLSILPVTRAMQHIRAGRFHEHDGD